ncbi:hypothetical protein CR513_20019, partial [Mucuna pruriens]
MNATIKDLKTQIEQLANNVSQLQSAGPSNLPSQTIPNPRGNASALPRSTDVNLELDVDSQMPLQNKTIPLSFPTQTISTRNPESDEELLRMFRKVEINISLLDAKKQIPMYAKFLKELCVHKRKKMKASVEIGGIVSEHKHYQRNAEIPEIFFVPCTIGNYTFVDAMLNLGASINVMPTSIYKSLNFGDLEPTRMTIQLANRSVVQPLGILEDVLVQVNELIFPTDFNVLDMEDEILGKGSTLILGRPFLITAKTKIDMHIGTLSMEFGDTLVQFNIFEAMKHPTKDHSLFGIDLIDKLVKENLMTTLSPPPRMELKPLPSHLKYAYLDAEQQLPVIIASNLRQEQKEKLLNILRQHKKAIGWKLSDLPGINPSICMHRILMEEEVKPIRQHKKAIGWKLSDLPRINPSICMHRILMEEEAKPIRQQQR